jgi:hypothetical protein
MNMIDKFEKLMNWLTDMDWGWWPFLSLRPPKDQEMSNGMMFKLTALYGSVVGIIFFVVFVTAAIGPLNLSDILCFLAFCMPVGWILYFAMMKISFAYFWNRRARRLRQLQK